MPNHINFKNEEIYLFPRVYCTLFYSCNEFDKNANSFSVGECNVLHIDMAWRLLEFVFCAVASVAALFYFSGDYYMKYDNEFCVYQKNDECTLDEIELDISGLCTTCIY